MSAGLEPERVESGNERRNPAVPRAVGEAQVAVDDRQRLRIARDARKKARAEVKHGPAFDPSAELAAPQGDDTSLQTLSPGPAQAAQAPDLPSVCDLEKLRETTGNSSIVGPYCVSRLRHGENDSRGPSGYANGEAKTGAREAGALEHAHRGTRSPRLQALASREGGVLAAA